MTRPLLLASASTIRLQLLRNAGLTVSAEAARIDEETIRQSLEAEQAKPREIADTLAELKAEKLANRHPTALVLGCDQVLAFTGGKGGGAKTQQGRKENRNLIYRKTYGKTHEKTHGTLLLTLHPALHFGG